MRFPAFIMDAIFWGYLFPIASNMNTIGIITLKIVSKNNSKL
jgi:hypothetical protein